MKLSLSLFLLAALFVGQSPQEQDRTFGLFNGHFLLILVCPATPLPRLLTEGPRGCHRFT